MLISWKIYSDVPVGIFDFARHDEWLSKQAKFRLAETFENLKEGSCNLRTNSKVGLKVHSKLPLATYLGHNFRQSFYTTPVQKAIMI